MRISTNLMAMKSGNINKKSNQKISQSVAKLSSGLRINQASDDAAGLAISEKMRSQIRGLDMASRNCSDATSLLDTAEGAMGSCHSILQRMNELAVQAASDTNDDIIDRKALNTEFQQLVTELRDIASNTTFNNINLLDGSIRTEWLSFGNGRHMKLNALSYGNQYDTNFSFSISKATVDGASSFYANIPGATPVKLQAGMDRITFDNGAIAYFDMLTEEDLEDRNILSITYYMRDNQIPITLESHEIKSNLYNGEYTLTAEDVGDVDSESYGDTIVTLTNTTDSTLKFSATIKDGAKGISAGEKPVLHLVSNDGNSHTIDIGINNQKDIAAGDLPTVLEDIFVKLDILAGDGVYSSHEITPPDHVGLIVQSGANSGDVTIINMDAIDNNIMINSFENGIITTGYYDSLNFSIRTRVLASNAINNINNAINNISSQRAYTGAKRNRFEHKISNLENTSENLTISERRIRDVDIAKEMTQLTKENILSQASMAMLAQANAIPQSVLTLLGK